MTRARHIGGGFVRRVGRVLGNNEICKDMSRSSEGHLGPRKEGL